MSEDVAGKNTLTRRDALKVIGTAAGTAFVPQPLPFVTDTFTGAEFTMTSIAPEEIPGGIDLTLTEAEKADFERLYAEVKDRREFPNSFDYLQKIQRMLNVSRARDMRGDTFVNFMNDFIDTPVDIESHGLSNVLGLKEFIKRFSAVRDNTLNGLVSTGTYGFWTAKLVESFVYCFDKEVQDVGFDFNTGNNILAYTQIVPEVVVDLFDETADYYQVPLTDANGRLAGDFFDSSKFIPDTGFIQREVGDIDQICLGDLIFKDRRQGYVNGHAMVVTDSIRDKNTGHTIGINVFDGNVDGKMISNFFSVETLAEFRSVISSNESLGILRTQEADNSLHLKLLEHETILPMSQIPPELLFGTAEVLPDFSKIKEIAAELEKFADPKKRPEAIRRVIALSGL